MFDTGSYGELDIAVTGKFDQQGPMVTIVASCGSSRSDTKTEPTQPGASQGSGSESELGFSILALHTSTITVDAIDREITAGGSPTDVSFEQHIADVLGALRLACTPLPDGKHLLEESTLGTWLTYRCVQKIYSRINVCRKNWTKAPWAVMMAWSPDKRDRRVIQPQIVHGVLEDLRPQLLEYGIRVSDSDNAEFNFENAGAWIRALAVWLSMAAESCEGQKPKVARLAYALIVVRFLHDIPGIQSVHQQKPKKRV